MLFLKSQSVTWCQILHTDKKIKLSTFDKSYDIDLDFEHIYPLLKDIY